MNKLKDMLDDTRPDLNRFKDEPEPESDSLATIALILLGAVLGAITTLCVFWFAGFHWH